jgi:hypothetical protein
LRRTLRLWINLDKDLVFIRSLTAEMKLLHHMNTASCKGVRPASCEDNIRLVDRERTLRAGTFQVTCESGRYYADEVLILAQSGRLALSTFLEFISAK